MHFNYELTQRYAATGHSSDQRHSAAKVSCAGVAAAVAISLHFNHVGETLIN